MTNLALDRSPETGGASLKYISTFAGVRNPFVFTVPKILPPAANAAETVNIKTAGKNTIIRHLRNFYTSCNYQTLLVIKISSTFQFFNLTHGRMTGR